jgi:hypothetical protein
MYRRTLYSLRHSYISFRLLEGADIYQIAKNEPFALAANDCFPPKVSKCAWCSIGH